MFVLTIKREDGSIYWVDNFNTEKEMNDWLIEEMTRPYWEESFTHSFVDNSPTEEELLQKELAIEAAETARQQKITSAKNKLKALGLTDDEVNALLGV